MVFENKEVSGNLYVNGKKEKIEQVYQELLELTEQYNSEPKGLNFDYKAEYAKQKINYFRSKGLSEKLLYPFEAKISVYLTQYVIDNLIEWYDFLGQRIDSFIMALKQLIDEKEFKRAKKLAEELVNFFVAVDEEELQNKIAVSDELGLRIYCRVKGVCSTNKDLFMKNDYAMIWVLYAHILKNIEVIEPDKERKLIDEAEIYLKQAIRMNPIRAEAWIELFSIYINEPDKYSNTLRQAFSYVYLPNGFGSIVSIYKALAIDLIKQKGPINLIVALQKAVQAFNGNTEEIDCLVRELKKMDELEEYLEISRENRNYEDVLYQYGIPVGFSSLVKCVAEEIFKSNESEFWEYLWKPIILDELEHGMNNLYPVFSEEEKERKKRIRKKIWRNWKRALKIALKSYVVGGFMDETRQLEVPENVKMEFEAFVKRYKIANEERFVSIYDDCGSNVINSSTLVKAVLNIIVTCFLIYKWLILGCIVLIIELLIIYKKRRVRRIWNERGDILGSTVEALEEMCIELEKFI